MNDKIDVVELLINHGAKIAITNSDGDTALMIEILWAKWEILNFHG